MIGFMIGFVIGVLFGVFNACLLFAGRDEDDDTI